MSSNPVKHSKIIIRSFLTEPEKQAKCNRRDRNNPPLDDDLDLELGGNEEIRVLVHTREIQMNAFPADPWLKASVSIEIKNVDICAGIPKNFEHGKGHQTEITSRTNGRVLQNRSEFNPPLKEMMKSSDCRLLVYIYKKT